MVYKDIYNPSSLTPGSALNERRRFKAWRIPLADPVSRWAALVVDLGVILAPLIPLILSSLKKQVTISEWLGKDLDFQVYTIIYLISTLIIVILYQGFFTAYFGGTPGKIFFGLRVVSIWNEERPNLGASFLRAFYWCLGALLFFLPHLAILYHRERRPIYDRLADTVVIAQERYAVGPPELSFSRTFRMSLSILYFGLMLILLQSFYTSFKERRQNQTANAIWHADEPDSCKVTAMAHQPLTPITPLQRIERAIALFAIGKIDDECLDREADNALWNFGDITAAYAAKAIVFLDEKTVFTKYLAKTCQQKSDIDYCLLLKALSLEQTSQKNPSKLDRLYFRMSQSSKNSIKLYATKYWLNRYDYAQAISVMDTMDADHNTNSYLAEARAKALWAMSYYEPSRAALYTYLPSADPGDRLYINSWFCYHESLLGCTNKQEHFCRTFNNHLKQYDSNQLDAELLISSIRHAECEHNESVNYRGFLNKTTQPYVRDLIGALIKKSSQRDTSHNMLLSILVAPKVDEIIRAESTFRLLESSPSTTALDSIFQVWQQNSNQFGEHWSMIGQKLFDELQNAKKYHQAFSVGQRLSRVVDNKSFRAALIQVAKSSGQEKYVSDVKAAFAERLPAALTKNKSARPAKSREPAP